VKQKPKKTKIMLFKQNGVPVVFTSRESVVSTKPVGLSPKQQQRFSKKAEIVVVEIDGKITIKEGICAKAIIALEMNGEYKHKLHWPEIKDGKFIRKNGYDPHCIAVVSNSRGRLLVKKGEAAKEIFEGKLPKSYTVEFIPPSKLKQLKKLKKLV